MLILDHAEAEDALQVALMRLTTHWARGIESPEAYARATLVNLARDRGRRRHLVPVPIEDLSRVDISPGEDLAEAHAARARLDQLLAQVPTRQRITIALRVIEGYSEAETAQLMQCSKGTVKSNLARGLAKLRASRPVPDSFQEAQP